MGGLLITFGIIVVMSILGYLTQMLKRASDRRQQERDRERERERRARAAQENPNPNPTNRNDLDRYFQAVDAQRQKAIPTARPVARAAPVPTVQPTRSKRADGIPTASPVGKRAKTAPPTIPTDDLPVATVVTPRGSVPTAAPLRPKPSIPAGTKSTGPVTPFARQLAVLLKSPHAPGLAIVLAEVFGPPKCRQGAGAGVSDQGPGASSAGAGDQGAVAGDKTQEREAGR